MIYLPTNLSCLDAWKQIELLLLRSLVSTLLVSFKSMTDVSIFLCIFNLEQSNSYQFALFFFPQINH